MVGDPTMDEFSDDALVRAVRRRILRELETQQGGGAASIVNNVYGGGGGAPAGGLQGLSDDPSMFDYFVDINKDDILNDDGKSIGWRKQVHRFRNPKKKVTE